jgi:hypothetical protein
MHNPSHNPLHNPLRTSPPDTGAPPIRRQRNDW